LTVESRVSLRNSPDPSSLKRGILAVAKKMHEGVFGKGVARVLTTVKIDDRRDKAQGMKEKVDSLKKKL